MRVEDKIKILENNIKILNEQQKKMEKKYKIQTILLEVESISRELLENILEDFDDEKWQSKINTLIQKVDELRRTNL